MNKVYVCYECEHNPYDVSITLKTVVDTLEKAEQWKAEFKPTETDWREYKEFSLE